MPVLQQRVRNLSTKKKAESNDASFATSHGRIDLMRPMRMRALFGPLCSTERPERPPRKAARLNPHYVPRICSSGEHEINGVAMCLLLRGLPRGSHIRSGVILRSGPKIVIATAKPTLSISRAVSAALLSAVGGMAALPDLRSELFHNRLGDRSGFEVQIRNLHVAGQRYECCRCLRQGQMRFGVLPAHLSSRGYAQS